MDRMSLERVLVTLQVVMSEIMMHDGGNKYKLKHMKKSELERVHSLDHLFGLDDKLRSKVEVRGEVV